MNNKGADQTGRMRRLICAFVVRIRQKQVLSHEVAHLVCNLNCSQKTDCHMIFLYCGLRFIENETRIFINRIHVHLGEKIGVFVTPLLHVCVFFLQNQFL